MSIGQHYYRIENWGVPYFKVNEIGHVVVNANGDEDQGDLFELVQSLVQRGIEPPILIRFNGILKDRIRHLQSAFEDAIKEFNYRNHYRITYPIKVNPQFHVVDEIQKEGSRHLIGLEVGSKPELIAVLTLEKNPEALLLCNGYKDAEYIELALLARKLGRRTIIIIEQTYEVGLVLECAKRLNIEPEIGLRFRPIHKGTGHWQKSSGEFAKFGLDTHEINLCLDQLKEAGQIDAVKLFHFHIGSQITSIESIKKALHEATRMYTELAKICLELSFFDAGGGLAVDYDGSKTISDSSMNYTTEEYARDIVSILGEACQKQQVMDPVILTESGRALVAHHAVLITEVIDVASILEGIGEVDAPLTKHDIPNTLFDLYQKVTPQNCLETLHDAFEFKEKIVDSFIHGQLALVERAYSERIYQHLIAKICHLSKQLKEVPEEIENLNKSRLDMFFCNFSVFQSIPDSWAIDQVFPIMPIHRLKEKPNRKAIIADLSCDSDGKIDHFVGYRGTCEPYIHLHEPNSAPYYLGIFLAGAYQEILGGLHNLFGDANAIHVDLKENGKWEIMHLVEGDTIEEALQYTQYHPNRLLEGLSELIEKSLKQGRLTNIESAFIRKKIKQSLESYTYLVV